MCDFAVKRGKSIIAQDLSSLQVAVQVAEMLEEYTGAEHQIVWTQAHAVPDCVIEFLSAREKYKQATSDDKDTVTIIKG